jgi:hypothetical protein
MGPWYCRKYQLPSRLSFVGNPRYNDWMVAAHVHSECGLTWHQEMRAWENRVQTMTSDIEEKLSSLTLSSKF